MKRSCAQSDERKNSLVYYFFSFTRAWLHLVQLNQELQLQATARDLRLMHAQLQSEGHFVAKEARNESSDRFFHLDTFWLFFLLTREYTSRDSLQGTWLVFQTLQRHGINHVEEFNPRRRTLPKSNSYRNPLWYDQHFPFHRVPFLLEDTVNQSLSAALFISTYYTHWINGGDVCSLVNKYLD